MINEIFPIKVYKSKYPGNLDVLKERLIPLLKPIFDSTKNNNQGSMRYGGLCSYNVCNDLWNHVEISEISEFVSQEAEKYWKSLDYVNCGISIFQTWANVYPPGAHIDAHNHSPVVLTGSFYLKKPKNSGEIVFENPLSTLLKHQPTKFLKVNEDYDSMFDRKVETEEGDLVLFPGWLTHKTEPNNSNDDRIIIGFNIMGNPY